MQRYLPPISELITLDQLPENLGFFRKGLTRIFSKLYFKDLYVDKSIYNEEVLYNLTLVSKTRLGFDFPNQDGLSLVLNSDFIDGTTTEFPVSLSYYWGILKYFDVFDISNFDFSPKAFFDLLIQISGTEEADLLARLIKYFYEDEDEDLGFPINRFIEDFNQQNKPTTPLIGLGDSEQIISDEEILEQLKTNGNEYNIIDILFNKYILRDNDNLGSPSQKIESYFSAFLGDLSLNNFEDFLVPEVSLSLNSLNASLEFPNTWLQPVDGNGKVIEGVKSQLRYNVGALLYDSKKGFDFNEISSFSFDRSQIGNTGLIIAFNDLKLDLQDDSNIPEAIADGRPSNFKGAYAETVAVTLPPRWFPNQAEEGTTATIAGRNFLVGTGGVSGTISLEATGSSIDPILKYKIGGAGFEVGFRFFDLTFKQNKIVASAISGQLTIPRFEDANGDIAQIDITGFFEENGDFNLTASEKDGFRPIKIPGILNIHMKGVELGKQDDNFYIGCACDFEFTNGIMKKLLGDQRIQIQKLHIYSNGSFEILGGTIPVPVSFKLNLGPVEIAITNISVGTHQQETPEGTRKYAVFGFDGALGLGPLGLDARGKGMQYYFTIDDGPKDSYFRIQTIEVDITIPGSASPETATAIIKGYLSIPQPGESTEYIGGISLNLPKLKIAGSAEFRLQPKYPAFIIDANVSLPVGIPVAPGLEISGFRGLLGLRYIAEKEAVGLRSGPGGDSWYDYYTYPKRGVNIAKFSGPNESENARSAFSLGAGATLNTSDKYLLSARLMLILSLPSTFILDGRANLLSSAIGLDDAGDPPFFAFIAIGDGSVEIGAGIDFGLPKNNGWIIDINSRMRAAFYKRQPSAWFINVGTRQNPNESRILRIVTMKSYLELSARGIAIGASSEFNFDKKFGPVKVKAWLYKRLGGQISFERPQIGGFAEVGGGADIRFWRIGIGISLHLGLAAEAARPFLLYAQFRVCGRIKIGFIKISKCVNVELRWEFSRTVNLSPVNPLPIYNADENVKGISMLNGDSYPLYRMSGGANPNQATFKRNVPILPLDAFVDIKFNKPVIPNGVNNKIRGVNSTPRGYIEKLPPVKNVGGIDIRQVVHQYSIQEINLQAWDGGKWIDYNPYEAITIEDRANINGKKIGVWQRTSKNEYNSIRLLGDSPFSYVQFGEPGWFVPEELGISPTSLFCENTRIRPKRANWRNVPIGVRYPLRETNPDFFYEKDNLYYALLGNPFTAGTNNSSTVDFAKVGRAGSGTHFNFNRGLQFKNTNPLHLKLKNESKEISFKLETGAEGVDFKFYKTSLVPIPGTETEEGVEVEIKREELSQLSTFKTASQLDREITFVTQNNNDLISEVIITPKAPQQEEIGQIRQEIKELTDTTIDALIQLDEETAIQDQARLDQLFQRLEALEAESCKRTLQHTTGISAMMITDDFIVGKTGTNNLPINSSQCYTTLFEVEWLTQDESTFNSNVPSQKEIEEDFKEGKNAVVKSVAPVWRPNTAYRVHFRLQDEVNGNGIHPFDYYYGFATAGPMGHYPTPNIISGRSMNYGQYISNNLKVTNVFEAEDKFAHSTLRNYIDYKRSYPNANGNLLRAKPLFYGGRIGENTISIFFTKPYVYHMLRKWSRYGNLPELENTMQIIIKDPIEDITFANPPRTETERKEIPATTIEWTKDNESLVPFWHRVYNNIANSNENCLVDKGEIIKPRSFVFETTVENLRPQKLYTAIVNSIFNGATQEIHNFVFQTSRYLDFRTQVLSYQLRSEVDGTFTESKAIHTVETSISNQDLSVAYGIVSKTGLQNSVSTFLEIEKLDYFDRVIEGLFELPPLAPAETTDFNIIKNTEGNVVALLIRNPEPFNDPKIPLDIIDGTKNRNNQGFAVLQANNTLDTNYKILYSKDYSQILVMYKQNSLIAITANQLNMRFNYLKWNGNRYLKQDVSVDVRGIVINEIV